MHDCGERKRNIRTSGRYSVASFLRLGSWYLGSRAFTRPLNPSSSTTEKGCMSLAIILITDSSSSLLRVEPCAYVENFSNADEIVDCCCWTVGLLEEEASVLQCLLSTSPGCFAFKCLSRLEVEDPSILRTALHKLQQARFSSFILSK